MRSRLTLCTLVTALSLVVSCGGGGDGATAVKTPTLSVLTISLTQSSIAIGQSATASAIGVDQDGRSTSTGTLAWASSNTNVATITGSGVVTGVAAGNTTITAKSGSVTGQTSLTVTDGTSSSGTVNVNLTAAGQSAVLLNSPATTVALTTAPAGGQYLIVAVNTDESASMREDFQLVGEPGALASLAPNAAVVRDQTPENTAARSFSVSRAELDRLRFAASPAKRRAEGPDELLDANRRLFATRGNPKAAWNARPGGRTAPFSAAVNQTVGNVNKVYVRNSVVGGCTSVDSIGARTVAIGQHVIVLADTNLTTWPQTFRPDSSFYQTFANEFDTITWPHILATVGDPLAFDKSLSSIGKVTVTITPVLNNLNGPAGGGSVVAFVNGCDFFPFAATGADADFSNQTEMFYSWVPASNGADVISWEKSLRATAAHETKHIVSYTDRITNDSPTFEETWLEEGLAQQSAEIWERRFNQATLSGGATFFQTVACEVNLGPNAPCDVANDKPLALIVSHLPFFFNYLQNESTNHTEGLGVDTPANYGAGWAFVRWATDHFGSANEGTFIKSLINEPTKSGLANLSAHTGQPTSALLAYFNLASAIFQTPSFNFAEPRATVPSFNFADIFRVGQTQLTCSGVRCGIFTSSGTPVYPVQPIPLTAGTFTSVMSQIPGTSAVFYTLTTGVSGVQNIRFTAQGGAALPAPSGLRLAILRVN